LTLVELTFVLFLVELILGNEDVFGRGVLDSFKSILKGYFRLGELDPISVL